VPASNAARPGTEPAGTGAAAVTPARPDNAGLPAGQPEADRDAATVRDFIEKFTGQLTMAGFPRTPARIFVALLTSDSSTLTAAQLGELLQTSPASVSGGVRYLIQVGLVVAEGEPGTRRQHYRMPENVWQDIVSMRDRMFGRWVAELREGVEALGPDSPAGVRMAETVRYFEFLSQEMLGLWARWREVRAAESGPIRPER
jgi:DNA-binding transcriptional regulator GbsR (MarR family)